MRFIHLSDPHLTTPADCRPRELLGKRLLSYLSWRRRRRFEHRREQLDALMMAVQAHKPDQLLVSGDLTHLGLPSELIQAREWLETLGPPERVTLVPGNHDVFARGSMAAVVQAWSPYLHLGSDVSYPVVRRFDGVEVIGLCSAVPTAPLLASGRIGKAQLERLQALLNTPFDGARILMLHHPPLPGMISRRKALADAAALDLLLAGNVDLVVHGHGHRNIEARSGTVQVLGITSASLSIASFRVIDVNAQADGGFEIATCLHESSGDGFVATAEQRYCVNPAKRHEWQQSAAD